MTVQCCVCKKVRSKGRWRLSLPGELAGQSPSSSYCPGCAKKAIQLMRDHRSSDSEADVVKLFGGR